MKSQEPDDLAIIIDPDDLENLSPCQISHRQRPSLKTTREITRFVRRYQRRLSFSPPSSPLHHSLNSKIALPAIKRSVDEHENGSSEAGAEDLNSNSPRWENNKRNKDFDSSQVNNGKDGGTIPSAFKRLIEDHRHVFQTIDMLNAQTPDIQAMQEADVRVHPKVIPQLPPIGMSSLPCRPRSPLPSQRRKYSDTSTSNSNDEWTEGKEEEEGDSKNDNDDDDDDDDDDVTFDKTMYFGQGDEVIKIIL